MKRFFTLFALLAVSACAGVLSFASSAAAAVDRAMDFAYNLLPDLLGAKAPFVIDNGHPRSPLASLRAGLA